MDNKNTIKFTDSELKEIRELTSAIQQNIYNFGQLYLEKMEIEEAISEIKKKEENLTKEYAKIQEEESKLIKKLTTSYGEGHLNIKDGTFIKSN